MKKCQICNNELKTIISNNIIYHKCINCEFISKDDSSILTSNEEYNRYLNHNYDDSYKTYMEKIFNGIKDYIIGDCLDFGCGAKPYLNEILLNNGFNCDIYDKYFYNNLVFNNYDTIILIEVIEHIKDVIDTLTYLKSILNKNGRIIIMTNLSDNKNLDNWWYVRDTTHISLFSYKTFSIVKEILGFKEVVIKGNIIILYA